MDCYNKKVEEHESYNQLLKTICEYFKIEIVTGLMLKQIKQYKIEFNYTYNGMIYTLWYAKEILNKNFITQYGVALIKYEYENAENYYLQQSKIEDSIEVGEEKIKYITIKKQPKQITNFLIDIDKIIKDGD